MRTAIVKYNAGNTASVWFALQRLGVEAIVTDDAREIEHADKVIVPGVGAAAAAMAYLKGLGLDKVISGLQQPVLGICLGMQLMCARSEEGAAGCLGIFDLEVKRFRGKEKIPAMGWNTVTQLKSVLFNGISENDFLYFVHSYYVPLSEYTIAVADYMHPYSAAIQKDNFYAVQFHPEKSGAAGAALLKNFTAL